MFSIPYQKLVPAISYAVTAHRGQYRKDGVTEYITHPLGVADIVFNNGGSEDQILAALFHDILEDCAETRENMHARWGSSITGMVVGLTNTSKQDRPELNRAQRKALDAERLARESEDVILVKLADVLYNLGDVESLDRGFARKFVGEKRQQVLTMMPECTFFAREWTEGHFQLRAACLQLADAQLEKLNAE